MNSQSAMMHALEPEVESFSWLSRSPVCEPKVDKAARNRNQEMQEQMSQLQREVAALLESSRHGAAERAELKVQLAEVKLGLTNVQLELAKLSGARNLIERVAWLLFGSLLTWLGLLWKGS